MHPYIKDRPSAKKLKLPRLPAVPQIGIDTPLGGSGRIKLAPVTPRSRAAAAGDGEGGKNTTRPAPQPRKLQLNAGISEEIEAQLEFIKTGDDVVEFYARHGQSSGVKFFYCNQTNCTDTMFRPYDLKVVDRLEVDPEYFTISAGGVTHVQGKAVQVDIRLTLG